MGRRDAIHQGVGLEVDCSQEIIHSPLLQNWTGSPHRCLSTEAGRGMEEESGSNTFIFLNQKPQKKNQKVRRKAK